MTLCSMSNRSIGSSWGYDLLIRDKVLVTDSERRLYSVWPTEKQKQQIKEQELKDAEKIKKEKEEAKLKAEREEKERKSFLYKFEIHWE